MRTLIFLILFAAFLLLESAFPRRGTDAQYRLRWPANLGLALIDVLVLALVPFAAAGAALYAQTHGFGLLNWLPLPDVLEFVLAWLALDCAIYWQHRGFHEIRALWPLHRVHHTDLEVDVTTALRFHPGEILLSLVYKCVLASALGAPPLAVLLAEATVNGFALFNHANLRVAPWLEARLRWILVTPDLHRIHHSVHRVETDSNYGSSLVLWDRLFGSYTPEPRDGHDRMQLGLPEFRDEHAQKLRALLTQPLK